MWLTALAPSNCATVCTLSIQNYPKVSKKKSCFTQHAITNLQTCLVHYPFFQHPIKWKLVFIVIRHIAFHAWWVPTLNRGERQRQTGIASTGVCHGCEEILLRRRRNGGRQRHTEADAAKCERVSVRLVMTRSWLRRAGEAAALPLTHLIPTGPPGWRHSACTVAFLCFNFFVSSSHTRAFPTSETLCAFVYV